MAAANVGRFLQGAGGAFSLVGAVYLVTRNFPDSMAASFIGATQMFGMAGGSAGQFLVGPMIEKGLPWGRFWLLAGLIGLALGGCLFAFLPREKDGPRSAGGWDSVLRSLKAVFLNPQSILCGLVSGLLFIPTTILAMTWGVRYLQEARGRTYEAAVLLAATVPLGWMIGCPLLGFVSDRRGDAAGLLLRRGRHQPQLDLGGHPLERAALVREGHLGDHEQAGHRQEVHEPEGPPPRSRDPGRRQQRSEHDRRFSIVRYMRSSRKNPMPSEGSTSSTPGVQARRRSVRSEVIGARDCSGL